MECTKCGYVNYINENEIAPVELEASDDTFFDDFFDTDDE